MTLYLNDHAIVVGGSIAGLLSARVLADYFESVTIVETDTLPELPDARRGVPQSVQPHILLTKGYRIIAELFPGIEDRLKAAGALPIDWAREFYLFNRNSWNASSPSPSHIVSLTCSRPLLEWGIRQELAKMTNVQFYQQQRVTGLVLHPSGKYITGVQLRSLVDSSYSELAASLVVDASGRRSQAPNWLQNLGFTPPPETVVNPLLGYATRRYRAPASTQTDWKVMLISQSPPDSTRLGYLAKIEGGEWIATLGGYGGDFPPLDNDGFLDFARTLPSMEFYQAIKEAEPISPIYAHRATANRLRHYEQIVIPQGFITLGDAVCALCPVYGQGMTVSAKAAMVLSDWLARQHNQRLIPSRFQKKLAQSNSFSWNVATSQDSRFPTTKGGSKPDRSGGLFAAYAERMLELTTTDSTIATVLLEVTQQLKSPLALFSPQIVWRVLKNS